MIFVPKQVVDLALGNVPDLRADYLGQYLVPCDSKDLKPITFNIAGTPLELYPEEYIVPHSIAGGVSVLDASSSYQTTNADSNADCKW